jgi:hypothetical protein
MALLSNTAASHYPVVAFALAPREDEPRLISVPGATVMSTTESSPKQATLALKSLRGFRATGRRRVWVDSTELSQTPGVDLTHWGSRILELSRVDTLLVTGQGSHQLALAARDAGLSVSQVTVCQDHAVARNLLCDTIAAGDATLLLGINQESTNKVVERLGSRAYQESSP